MRNFLSKFNKEQNIEIYNIYSKQTIIGKTVFSSSWVDFGIYSLSFKINENRNINLPYEEIVSLKSKLIN